MDVESALTKITRNKAAVTDVIVIEILQFLNGFEMSRIMGIIDDIYYTDGILEYPNRYIFIAIPKDMNVDSIG